MSAPPISYYGGKTRLADRIVAQLPAHEHYVETFAGSLAVLLAKVPARMETSMPAYLRGYLSRMYDTAERLASVSLECRPALELIEIYGSHPEVCLYVDPPYLASTRTGSNYGREMATEGEHRELAAALQECRASVVLSGYDSPLYAELYDGWHVTRINTMTGQGGTRQDRTEVLWINREPLDMLPFGEVAS
jgi:DNA adenine methylase